MNLSWAALTGLLLAVAIVGHTIGFIAGRHSMNRQWLEWWGKNQRPPFGGRLSIFKVFKHYRRNR